MRAWWAIVGLGLVVGCDSSAPGRDDPVCGNGRIEAGEACDDGEGNSDEDPWACRVDCSSWCRCSRHLECTFAGESYACAGECPAGYTEYDGGPNGVGYERFCDLDPVAIEYLPEGAADPVAADHYLYGGHLAEVEGAVERVALIVTAPPTIAISVAGAPVASGEVSPWIDLRYGSNLVEVELHDTVEGFEVPGPPVVVQRGMDMSYIKASNTGAEDRFGEVAVDGDTLVVGAAGEASAAVDIDGDQLDDSAPDRGAVYVFRHDGAAWSQEAYLKSPSPGERFFGGGVAISGDLVAVRGTAGIRIFERVAGAWRFEALVPGSTCGLRPHLAGDTLAFLCEHTVRVHRRGAGDWPLEASLTGADAPGGFRLVEDIALAGDTLVARGEKEVRTDEIDEFEFTTFVFARAGTSWSLEQSLCVEPDWCSGLTVLSGDGNRMAVRARAVHVLARTGGGWRTETTIALETPELGDVLALDGDRLAIRAGGLFEVTWLYQRGSDGWQEVALVAHPTLMNGGNLFWSLDLTGDVLAMGALRESSGATGIDGDPLDTSAPEAGAAFVLRLP